MSFLQRIVAARRDDALRRRASGALDEAEEAARLTGPVRGFAASLAAPGMSLIAEVKRASPSAGEIRAAADPVALGQAYERGGAAAISVLTEPEYFRGSLDDLRSVRSTVSLPVLRKDFICDPLHVYEARAAGADAILLIVAALSDEELHALASLTARLQMAALIEVHDADELERARRAGASIVGINTRNLSTLEVDPGVVKELRPLVDDGVIVVGESGVSTRADVEALEAIGCHAVLIGETLMRAPDPQAKVAELLGRLPG